MTCVTPLYFAFFFLLCIPNLGNSNTHTATNSTMTMTSHLMRRQASGEEGEGEGEDYVDPSDPCWKFSVGYRRGMEFYSPMYPEQYPRKIDCLKVITAPEGKIIRLDFRDQFNMEGDDGCTFDSLEVRDGPKGYSNMVGRYCGNVFPDMITSSDRYLWLRFKSDDSIEYSGFRAVYSFIDRPGDNQHKAESCEYHKTGPEGWVNRTDVANETIARHTAFNERLDCMFIISVKEGWNLMLQFITYKLDKPNECESNFIEVYPNVTFVPARLHQFCGSIAKPSIEVESNVTHIRFVAEPKAFNSTFAILWTAYRKKTKDEECAKDEFDCEDLNCIPMELKCNGNNNCRYNNDEDTEETCKETISTMGKVFSESHMIAIVALFFVILTGMCSTFIYNCSKKLIRDHKIIKKQMAESRASRLDQLGKPVNDIQLSTVLPVSHSHSTDSSVSVAQRAECYVPETELLPILGGSSHNEELLLPEDLHFPEMRDSECQTRESLFHMVSFTPNSSGGESITPPPPPPPPTSRPPRSTPRSAASPGFTTFGKTRQKASAEPRFRAEAVIELSKRGDNSSKTSERPFSVQSTKSAPDVIVTH